MNKLILTSRGLTTGVGRELIGNEIKKYDLSGEKIFVFHEPNVFTEKPIKEACIDMGFDEKNIIFSSDKNNLKDITNCKFYYCGEGNCFEILSLMREKHVVEAIRLAFSGGDRIYIGASAGASIAGSSIKELMDFEKDIIGMKDYTALELYKGLIIPHYNKHQLKTYISNSPGIETRYNNIVNVSNDGILVMEVS